MKSIAIIPPSSRVKISRLVYFSFPLIYFLNFSLKIIIILYIKPLEAKSNDQRDGLKTVVFILQTPTYNFSDYIPEYILSSSRYLQNSLILMHNLTKNETATRYKKLFGFENPPFL